MTSSLNYVPERELLVTGRTSWGRQWRHACGQLQGNDTDVLPPVSRSCPFRGNHLQLYANSSSPENKLIHSSAAQKLFHLWSVTQRGTEQFIIARERLESRRDGLKQVQKGSTERGLALLLQHQAQARVWKDLGVVVTRGLSWVSKKHINEFCWCHSDRAQQTGVTTGPVGAHQLHTEFNFPHQKPPQDTKLLRMNKNQHQECPELPSHWAQPQESNARNTQAKIIPSFSEVRD